MRVLSPNGCDQQSDENVAASHDREVEMRVAAWAVSRGPPSVCQALSCDVTCNLGMTQGLLQNLRHGGGGNSGSEKGASSDSNSMREQVPKNLVLIKNPLDIWPPLPVTSVPTAPLAVWGRWPRALL